MILCSICSKTILRYYVSKVFSNFLNVYTNQQINRAIDNLIRKKIVCVDNSYAVHKLCMVFHIMYDKNPMDRYMYLKQIHDLN